MSANFPELEKMGISRKLAEEILNDGIESIVLRSDLAAEAIYFKNLKIIVIRPLSEYELKAGAEKIAFEEVIDLLPNELMTWLLLHEWGHHKNLREPEADAFASKELAKRRGYYRKFKVEISDQARLVPYR